MQPGTPCWLESGVVRMTEHNQRPRAEVLADAISVLTEAARLRHPMLQQGTPGDWQPHPSRTEQSDWADRVRQPSTRRRYSEHRQC